MEALTRPVDNLGRNDSQILDPTRDVAQLFSQSIRPPGAASLRPSKPAAAVFLALHGADKRCLLTDSEALFVASH